MSTSPRKLTQEELNRQIDSHERYLKGDPEGERLCIRFCDLSGKNLYERKLNGAEFDYCRIHQANFEKSNLTYAKFFSCSLEDSDMSLANLEGTGFHNTNTIRVVFSQSTGLISQSEFLSNFERDSDGFIVYKAFGNTAYSSPSSWKIKKGSILKEVCNSNRQDECGCGINVASLEWCQENFPQARTYWKCRIPYGAEIVVPYNTDGKFRCAELELLEEVK